MLLIVLLWFSVTIVTCKHIPEVPKGGDGSAVQVARDAADAAMNWGKDIALGVLGSLVPVLAALLGNLFGSKQREESASGNS